MSAVNPQADIDAIVLDEIGAKESLTVLEQRQLFDLAVRLKARLASVEKLRDEWVGKVDEGYGGIDLSLVVLRLDRILGAAGSQGQSGETPKDTPTPQDDEADTLGDELRGLAGTWVNDPHLDRSTAIQCANDMGSVLDRYSPVTSTPEAATEADRRPHSRACGWKAHPHGPDCAVDCPTCAPSGLQRATEQQAIALHAARCDWGWDGSPYKSAADCWAAAGHDEHREGFRRQASELIAILAIGPADQPERCKHHKTEPHDFMRANMAGEEGPILVHCPGSDTPADQPDKDVQR